MLIASNRGVGQNIGFPDPCLTPAGPLVVVVPYPNLGMNVLAIGFSLNVFWTFMNALTIASKIAMTLGMNPGVAHPLYMMPGGYTMGSFIVFINFLPGIHLCCISYGNNYNNPMGGALVPSVTVVFITLRDAATEPGRLSQADVARLSAVMRGEGELPSVEAARIDERTVCLTLRSFSTHSTTRVWNALRRVGRLEQLIIDVRGNPGGDGEAALRLAADFAPVGTVLAVRRDGGGHEVAIEARQEGVYRWPVAIVIDGGTASAAEVFAGAMQASGRARLIGGRTHGKTTAQRIVPAAAGALCETGEDMHRGGARYATVAEFRLPDGTAIDGVGLTPDVALDADALAGPAALALAEALLDELPPSAQNDAYFPA